MEAEEIFYNPNLAEENNGFESLNDLKKLYERLIQLRETMLDVIKDTRFNGHAVYEPFFVEKVEKEIENLEVEIEELQKLIVETKTFMVEKDNLRSVTQKIETAVARSDLLVRDILGGFEV